MIRIDLTDLLALPMLLIAWKLWEVAGEATAKQKGRGLAMLMLGALASIATSPPPQDIGINCLFETNSGPIAANWSYTPSIYASYDGGLSWQGATVAVDYQQCSRINSSTQVVDPVNSSVSYRFGNADVERSDDSGQTWTSEFS